MRIYKLLIILLTVLSIKTYAQDGSLAQNSISSRLMQRDTGLVMLGRHRCSSYLVIAAAVERRSHKLYMLDRFGNTWDTVKIRPGDYNAILTKQINAFDYYVSLHHQSIVLGNELIRQFREYGRLDSLSPFYTSLLQNFPEFRLTDSAAVIQHILKLQREIMRDSLYAWSGNAGTPRNFEDSVTYTHDDPSSAMLTKGDTVLLINPDKFSPVHVAVLVRKQPMLRYFSRDGTFLANIMMAPKDSAKTDVFRNYLKMLEVDRLMLHKQVDLYSTKIVQYAALKQENQQNLYNAASRLRMLDEKIAFATSPDLKAVMTWLDNAYLYKNDNPYWLAFLGINMYQTWQTTGSKEYELTNQLGNVVATITDKRIQHSSDGRTVDYFTPDVSTAQEYYAFGGLMPGRTFTDSAAYRYGFNGKENDNEVKGTGNQQDYGERIYDPRVGRFLSVDPIAQHFPWNTPYSFAENKVIEGVDFDGLEVMIVTQKSDATIYNVGIQNTSKDEINVYAHGTQRGLGNNDGLWFHNESEFDKYMTKVSDQWRNRKNDGSTVLVLHSCRTGRAIVNDKGEVRGLSIGQKISKQFNITVVAPDERDNFGKDGEIGPLVDEDQDINGNHPDGGHHKSTDIQGNWNVFKDGKLIESYRGGWTPKAKATWWDKLIYGRDIKKIPQPEVKVPDSGPTPDNGKSEDKDKKSD